MAPMYRSVNKDFFKKWSPDMSYVLGFFAADGYITINKRGGRYISLQVTDRDIVENILDTIESNHKVSARKQKSKNWNTLHRFQIGSKEIFQDLVNLGMTPNKTKTLYFPQIPQVFLGHFVRGYFDGDGNVWVGEVHKERKTKLLVIHSVFTCSTGSFLCKLKKELKCAGLKGGSMVKRKETFKLQYSIKDSILLYHLMYDKCTNDLFLKRKKDKFEKYIQYKGT